MLDSAGLLLAGFPWLTTSSARRCAETIHQTVQYQELQSSSIRDGARNTQYLHWSSVCFCISTGDSTVSAHAVDTAL
ncbi:hypothetical protein K438DRAFT_1854857 [Mycena galopus ATCC 62051]|nr:hypothetical protein K438DRAFT_1854857 [Mycena galopus ATCC 62051]